MEKIKKKEKNYLEDFINSGVRKLLEKGPIKRIVKMQKKTLDAVIPCMTTHNTVIIIYFNS